MDRLFEALKPLVRAVVRHPFLVVGIALVATVVCTYFAAQLHIDSDFANLLPADYPSVQAINKLREEVGGENEAALIIESPSFEANKRFAEDFIPGAMALCSSDSTPLFREFDYRRELDFLKDNALYLATPEELDSLEKALNRKIRDAKLEANPFYFDLEEEENEETRDSTLIRLQELYDQIVAKEYPISDDSMTMAVRFYPSGSQTDIAYIEEAYAALQELIDTMVPARYHPEMQVSLGGRLLRQLTEVRAITDDVWDSFGGGVVTLLVMVVAYFFYKNYQARAGWQWAPRVFATEVLRMPITTLILGIPMLASLAWTFGVVYWTYGVLNIMTSTLGLVLFGLGIDFGIHFYARYAEERGDGLSPEDAIVQTFVTTGQAITVVAITTAAAFYLLMMADFKGFSQFGFTAGTGTMLALLSMLILVPALLVFLEHTHLLHLSAVERRKPGNAVRSEVNHRFSLGAWWHKLHLRVSSVLLWLCITALVASVFTLKNVAFEYDFSLLSPRLDQYEALKAKWRKVYNDRNTRLAAYVLVDSPDEAHEVAETLRQYAKRDTLTPTIESVEVLQDRFPLDPAAQQAKLEQIEDIRDLLDDPILNVEEDENLKRLRRAAGTRTPLHLDQLPDYLKRPFTTKNGEIGQLVIIHPVEGLSDGRVAMRFADDVGMIETPSGAIYHTSSTSIVSSDMLRLMIDETPRLVVLTILLVVTFKLVILRRPKWVLLALLPLASSFIWMFGLMTTLGLKLTFYNLVVLPTVLGIGDDSGIHLVHRYLEEGPGSTGRVLRSTGEHITMSAMTTMVGFGGLMFSMHPGIRSIGDLAVIGIGMTLLAALVFLPALLLWMERRQSRKALETNQPAGVD